MASAYRCFRGQFNDTIENEKGPERIIYLHLDAWLSGGKPQEDTVIVAPNLPLHEVADEDGTVASCIRTSAKICHKEQHRLQAIKMRAPLFARLQPSFHPLGNGEDLRRERLSHVTHFAVDLGMKKRNAFFHV